MSLRVDIQRSLCYHQIMAITDEALARAICAPRATLAGWMFRGLLRRPAGGWTPGDAVLLRIVHVLSALGMPLRAAFDLVEARREAILAGRGWLVALTQPGEAPTALLVSRQEDLIALTSHGLLRGPQAGVVSIDLAGSRDVVLAALQKPVRPVAAPVDPKQPEVRA